MSQASAKEHVLTEVFGSMIPVNDREANVEVFAKENWENWIKAHDSNFFRRSFKMSEEVQPFSKWVLEAKMHADDYIGNYDSHMNSIAAEFPFEIFLSIP